VFIKVPVAQNAVWRVSGPAQYATDNVLEVEL